jgi:hypothetical protein
MSQLLLTPEPNGNHASTPLETKLNAVHAGLSEHQRLFQIDSVFLQLERSMLFSHPKISYPAMRLTKDAMEDISPWPGDT